MGFTIELLVPNIGYTHSFRRLFGVSHELILMKIPDRAERKQRHKMTWTISQVCDHCIFFTSRPSALFCPHLGPSVSVAVKLQIERTSFKHKRATWQAGEMECALTNKGIPTTCY